MTQQHGQQPMDEEKTMNDRAQQGVTQAGAVPARIQLDDFIEAVSRGVARALAAQDEVSGYAMALPRPAPTGPILIGIYFPTNPGDWSGGGSRPPFDPSPPILERR
jgi:hypothetical protein